MRSDWPVNTGQQIPMNVQVTNSLPTVATTLNTLANANELIRQVVLEVVGNDVADTINGVPITGTTINQLSQAVFTNKLSKFRGN